VRSRLAVPVIVTNEPAAQSVHALHVDAFAALVNVPDAQAAQVRSAVLLPADTTRWPATQSLHAVHDAWPGAAAKVPDEHAASAPPVQNGPAGHVVHAVAFVVVE
jgi:hypothetical protein